jgi:hypothetical protein
VTKIKDRAVLAGWIAGLLIAISLLWIITQPLQSRYLLKSVNRILVSKGDPRRLIEVLPKNDIKPPLLGFWFSMFNTTEKMFVFPVFQYGIFITLGAIVLPDGKVDEIIPLSVHAVQKMENISKSILQIYIVRIETALQQRENI